MERSVIFSENIDTDLATALAACTPDRIFVLTDENTRACCRPALCRLPCLSEAHLITIPPSDTHKNLDTLSRVWQALQAGGATRHSCMLNLGGGMVTDLGGFAASTFKRGIRFINLPTTLLAMTDASVGGKTGINFGGLKNEIGVFSNPYRVLISTGFLKTLDTQNLRSGYAEMVKHGLIANIDHWAELMAYDLAAPDLLRLQPMLEKSVMVKERIVRQDPKEQGIRKALNLGHTFGHAFESFSMQHHPDSPLLHGYAVAFGIICELYLSAVKTGFPTDHLHQTVHFIRRYYGSFPITCNDYPELIALMRHDKKNTADTINFTLLTDIGNVCIDRTATEKEIAEALDFFREG